MTYIPALAHPVAVFDAGLGSFDLVRRLRAAYPTQDIIYLADRASFPYGAKSVPDLLHSVARACQTLVVHGASAIVLASNAPSVTVLDELRPRFGIPIFGITPPIRAGLDLLGEDSFLAIAGARVMVESTALRALISAEAGPDAARVVSVAAEELIGLVESGAFLDKARIRHPLEDFLHALRTQYPNLAGMTLSSTHLPWLAPALQELAPDLRLFDPADDVVADFAPFVIPGSGRLLTLVTESPAHPLSEFNAMTKQLGLNLNPQLIEIP
ncbi:MULTISPECIES: glutamate racemase [Corynebacterium]|nr:MULTISPECIES: aspartate/glutamate racemase family protein [Corynebacterium]MDN6100636.1 aspartate/glutamate racemase family protein [Corynebacterium flavescens]MDN6198557.1 aspartate/glutamate racemase family protein [Corynebacterium flavescens]MDN6647222.1 aspartate/glutamate racemase family protein [Corynebacterium flavescens]MDN6688627.1 aspartate/glutamate racemase family protein [Corynebacterium flavescens]HCG46610.1 Asp/Glu racemase [Corynebacterium flavescens]